MAPQPKRKYETIDLTGSDDDYPPRKSVTQSAHGKPPSKPSSSMSGDGRAAASSPSRPGATRGQWRRPSASESFSQTPSSSRSEYTSSQVPSSRQQSAWSPPHSPLAGRGGSGLTRSQAERDSWLAPSHSQSNTDETDIYDAISSSQDVVVGSEDFVKYSGIPTKIVGVRYYRGFASFNEHVELLREPGNPYDSNAIRVDNMVGEQIGHIPKTMAAKLAKYVDNGWLALEAVISGSIGQFDCPIIVSAFGPPLNTPASQELRERMKADRLPLQHVNQLEREAKKRHTQELKNASKLSKQAHSDKSEWMGSQTLGDGSQPDQTMDDIVSTSERFNPRDVGKAAEQFGSTEDDLAAMPLAKQPEQIATQMLPYQLQALAWLRDKEHPVLPAVGSTDYVQLWKRHEKVPNAFTNIATSFSVKDREPTLASGGILADDMGLGKTLEMISLIVTDQKSSKSAPGECSATLIIAPLSVMSNWSDQIARHVRKDKPLRVYTYHGAGRKPMKPAELAEYDVVITTYQTLSSDYLPAKTSKPRPVPRPTGLYSTKWRRIILDEGHIVRNPSSKGAAAVTAVLARSKWVLTGTPIINSLKDLYSLIRFIGLTGGLEKLDIFNSVLVRPLKAGDPAATALLQAIMSALCLRRKKEMAFIDLKLPPLEEFISRITFSDHEKKRYDAFYKEAKGTLQTYRNAEGRKAADAYNHLLEILLRMRQVCNHWQLCGERVNSLMETLQSQQTVDLTPDNCKALQDMLQLSIESQDECPICLETLHNPVITHCAHAFGRECISRVIEAQKKCPLCRAELKGEEVLVEPVHEYGDESKDDELDLNSSSTKLEALVNILKASKGSGNKTVVFSQWTRFLDIVQARLEREGFKLCRIDGTMSAALRDQALHTLEDDPSCTVMLASLGVCAVGLNLVAANQIILSDTWWSPAIEDQCVDRVHRLGQKKETKVFRLVMDGSIEERTLEIQAEKRKLMMMAFRERNNKRGGGRSARLGDITKLLR